MDISPKNVLDRLIKWLVILGFLSLPYTHLKWMPDLGTTRPVSTVFFALAFMLVVIQGISFNGFILKKWYLWPRSWEQWPVLRWWVWLIGLGVVSAAITPFYGLPIQAITRLLGYFAIFVTLFVGAYCLSTYGIEWVAGWTLIGYVPILIYGIIEALAILKFPWATDLILWFRDQVLVPFPWGYRLSLFATEPSFVAFQVLLVVFLIPFVRRRWLKWTGGALVLLSLIFSQSGTVYILGGIILVLWGLFSLRRQVLVPVAAGSVAVGGLVLSFTAFVPWVQPAIDTAAQAVFTMDRLEKMMISFQIRLHYILNLVYALVETKGLGLGIGQYGYFWKDIYLRHFDYRQFDPTGEMARALFQPGEYMKPWSVILGIGVDLGLIGLILLFGFFWQVYRCLQAPLQKAFFFACLAALSGAYPIITPHVWMVLVLLAGLGKEQRRRELAG